MAHIAVTSNRGVAPGRCRYDTFCLWGETEHWYDQDAWLYTIDRLCFACTAWREVLTVDGYLPHTLWKQVDQVDLPETLEGQGFVIEERFEPGGRVASELSPYDVVWSPRQRIVHVRIACNNLAPKIYVSPHRGLLLGAAGSPNGILSDVIFADVMGLPSY